MKEDKKGSEVNQNLRNQIRKQIEQVTYGTVKVVIHDGEVVQLDTNTKIRLAGL